MWVPLDSRSDFGRELGASKGLFLPHLVDDPDRRTPNGGLNTPLNARTLHLGILMTNEAQAARSPGVTLPSKIQLLKTLRMLAGSFGSDSEDELCANGAAYLRRRHGEDAAETALRRTIELVPDCTFCRGDLIGSLFVGATAENLDADSSLQEAATEFLVWSSYDQSRSANRDAVLYCGLAALTYLGRISERNALLSKHGEVVKSSPWLSDRVVTLRKARPNRIGDIACDFE